MCSQSEDARWSESLLVGVGGGWWGWAAQCTGGECIRLSIVDNEHDWRKQATSIDSLSKWNAIINRTSLAQSGIQKGTGKMSK